MDANATIVDLAETGEADQAMLGGKAVKLARLLAAGFAVPPGIVVTAEAVHDPQLDARVRVAAEQLGADRFAVRSSGAAEDLPDASYAGLYETYLNVPPAQLGAAVRRCFAAATSDRVAAYHARQGGSAAAMAVLVQVMVDPVVAGVAFTAHPVTGDRDQTLVTAVPGLGEPLVSGEAVGEEWSIHTGRDPDRTHQAVGGDVLTGEQAAQIAQLARGVAARYSSTPQDIEWAIDHAGKLWLLQARSMTAVPQPVSWTAPGPGLWMRNFRLGEWLPEAVTPLFATWLLPLIEDGYLNGMQATVGVQVPFRYAVVNGWYYNATPIPSPRLVARVLWQGRARAVKVLFNALFRVSRNPAAADRAVLSGLERRWRDEQLPRYRHLVEQAAAEAATAPPSRLIELVDTLGHEAGTALWYLAIVGGSAWKMESVLTSFTRRHLASVLPDQEGGAQMLLRGLPGARPTFTAHAVHSVDWFHPTAAELPPPPPASGGDKQATQARLRQTAEHRCHSALAGRPRLAAEFDRLLAVNQRYAITREHQAREFTLAWPLLRICAARLGHHLAEIGLIASPDDLFFYTRHEVTTALTGHGAPPLAEIAQRRALWQQQRRLTAPLTLGRPARLIGDVIDHAVQRARGNAETTAATIVGHPASAGRATGPVRIIHGPDDFATFTDGDVLVAQATAPAWTPLFGRAAALVTDGGTLAAHASLVAREYGIPAVVGTGDATARLRTGQVVTVDGTAGTITLQPQP